MLDREDLEYLAARRARPVPRRWPRRAALAALVVAHLGVLSLLLRASAERTLVHAPRSDDVMVVRLLPPDPIEPASAPPSEPVAAGASAPRARADVAADMPPGADVEVLPGPESNDRPLVFRPDGSLVLPPNASEPPGWVAFRTPERAALPNPANPVRYTPTRWDPVWAPDHETLGQRLVRETTVVKTYDTKNGTRISCVWSPLMLGAFGCGWGLAPRDPPKPAPWLAVAGETRPEKPVPLDPDPFD